MFFIVEIHHKTVEALMDIEDLTLLEAENEVWRELEELDD
jgi:hypothetical protein